MSSKKRRPATPDWEPLLEGESKARAVEIVRAVLAQVTAETSRLEFELAGGSAGYALLAAEASRVKGLRVAPSLPAKLLSQSMEWVSSVAAPPGLFSGFTGVAFAIELARALGRKDVEGASELDRMLLESISEPLPPTTEVDLTDGLVGLGVYALSRGSRAAARELVAQVVARIEHRAEKQSEGVAWRTPPRPPAPRLLPDEVLDLGLAHGTPGILSFLAAAYARGIEAPRCERLLREGMKWVLSQRLPSKGARFPLAAGMKGTPTPARSGWCYGDPGVALSLFTVARALGDEEWERTAIELAVDSSQRPFKQTGIVDAGVCHGSAGLAHLFHRLSRATGDSQLREAAQSYLMRTLDFAEREGGVKFFGVNPAGEEGWSEDLRLLTGAAGVALVLVSAVGSEPPVWDRLLLADVEWLTAAK